MVVVDMLSNQILPTDEQLIKPKLSISFVKPGLQEPNIKVQYNKDKTFIQHDDNDIIIYTQSKDPAFVAKHLVKCVKDSQLTNFSCYFHDDMEIDKIALICICEYYAFDLLKTCETLQDKSVSFICAENQIYTSLSNKLDEIKIRGQFCHLIRYLVDMPPNILTPAFMRDVALNIKDIINDKRFTVEVIDQKLIENEMGGLYNVGKGSNHSPQMIIMKWTANSSQNNIGVVGKGITFDTGGVSQKTPKYMENMHEDMNGAAIAMSVGFAAAMLKLNTNVVVALPCAENAESDKAMKPESVINIYKGKLTRKVNTVEVINTDAEGRLVLVDAFAYIQDKYQISDIISIATLTGAIKHALGDDIAGLFCNNNDMSSELHASARCENEEIWRMPMSKKIFGKHIQSKRADISNVDRTPAGAGASIAATFLEYFIQDHIRFAHFDIAGIHSTKKYCMFNTLLTFIKERSLQSIKN